MEAKYSTRARSLCDPSAIDPSTPPILADLFRTFAPAALSSHSVPPYLSRRKNILAVGQAQHCQPVLK